MPTDLTGNRYERLVCMTRAPNRGASIVWNCRCDCGANTVVYAQNLQCGRTRSCGCLRKEYAAINGAKSRRHGMEDTRTYRAWAGAKSRCQNPNDPGYKRYGGRGIRICERWQFFVNFLADMGEAPARLEIDRIDNDGNYEPGNCRWTTRQKNAQNRRGVRNITFNGRTQCLAAWARDTGLGSTCISQRLARGWSLPRALGFIDCEYPNSPCEAE